MPYEAVIGNTRNAREFSERPLTSRRSMGDVVVRFADIVISLAALIFLLPALVLVAVLVKLQDGGPILFAQTRIGRGMREFKCLKFRSMRINAADMLARLL